MDQRSQSPCAGTPGSLPTTSIPESDLRTSIQPHHRQPALNYGSPSHNDSGGNNDNPYSTGPYFVDPRPPQALAQSFVQPTYQTPEHAFANPEYSNTLQSSINTAFPSWPQDDLLSDSAMPFNLPDMPSDDEILRAIQACNDCTSATATSIPHHHHTSGRLAGASAQLDGHFCCSWIVHDQPCFLCFLSAEALDDHIKRDHAGKDGTYRCMWQDCAKRDSSNTAQPVNFGNKPKLMRHVHSHTGYKPYLCPYPGCDKGFVTKEQLRNHETTHTKTRKYKCEQCDKAFAVKSALTTHITAVHEGAKTHICDICNKAFADSSNLSKHKQTHYRTSGVSKRRRSAANTTPRRSTPDGTTSTARTTPSLPTPTQMPATPAPLASRPGKPSLFISPGGPSHTSPSSFLSIRPPTFSTSSCAGAPAFSPSSPAPFNKDCYCCEHDCPPPAGPPSPCNATDEDCDRAGFCDLPGCLPEGIESCNSHSHCLSSTTDPLLAPHQILALSQFQQLHHRQHHQHGQGSPWEDSPTRWENGWEQQHQQQQYESHAQQSLPSPLDPPIHGSHQHQHQHQHQHPQSQAHMQMQMSDFERLCTNMHGTGS